MDATALFKQYEADYCNKSTDASRKIASLEGLSGDTRRRKLQEIESDLRAAEDVVKRMDMEARSLPTEQSKNLLVNVKNYKADLLALKEQVKTATAAVPLGDAARAELGLAGDYLTNSAGQRDRMLTATQRLEKSSDTLQYGKEQLMQTEEIGASILRDLHSQRETILHTRNTLQGADDNITKARKILSNMSRLITQNKIIMGAVIALLILGIVLIIYVKAK